ncbi:hypothetical protein [uncultured Fibrella sp.]|uniref:hypothetical protein n=1 Tax=uncultured Fibrella sp. TaxID=1284596 RepID=UPI0035C9BFAB
MILFLSSLYVVSFMPSLVKAFVMARDKFPSNHPFASDKLRFGDLYGISFIPTFRMPYQTHSQTLDLAGIQPGKPYNLCILGDSYKGAALLQSSAFTHVNELTLGEVEGILTNQLTVPDAQYQSVLVLETAERYVRARLGSTTIDTARPVPVSLNSLSWLQQQSMRLIRAFCRDSSTDLEYFVFDYGCLRPLKEARAALAFRYFDRVPDGVGISANKQHLYLKETLLGEKTSSFAALDSVEVDSIVANLNRLNRRALQKGYKAVYLSIIPNPVSVIEPTRSAYNHLIERVEQHPALEMGVISLYERFSKNGGYYYHPSDSHWNQAGIDVWVRSMNHIIDPNLPISAL